MPKVLIVDDERSVVLLLRQMLNERGYDTCEAPNGLAGLKWFQSQFIDLIITDLKMPNMDGMTFLREVKRQEPATPVIILTAYGSPESATEAKESGAFTYLSKPFEMEELLRVVESLVGPGKSRNDLAFVS